jgi:hypothetical protein
VLGEQWNRVLQSVDETKILMVGLVAAAVVAWLVFGYLRRKRKRLITPS